MQIQLSDGPMTIQKSVANTIWTPMNFPFFTKMHISSGGMKTIFLSLSTTEWSVLLGGTRQQKGLGLGFKHPNMTDWSNGSRTWRCLPSHLPFWGFYFSDPSLLLRTLILDSGWFISLLPRFVEQNHKRNRENSSMHCTDSEDNKKITISLGTLSYVNFMCQNSSFYAEMLNSPKSLGVGHWFWSVSDLVYSIINKIDFTAAEERSGFCFVKQTLAFSHTAIYFIPCISSMEVKLKVMRLAHHNSKAHHSTSEMQSNAFPSSFLKGCMKFLLGYWQELSQTEECLWLI